MNRILVTAYLLAAIGFTSLSHPAAVAPVEASSQAASGDPWDMDLLAQVGGVPTDIVIQGSLAYLGAGTHLEILDISNPVRSGESGEGMPDAPSRSDFTPIKLGQTAPMPEMFNAVSVFNDRTYAVSTHYLYIFNTTNPDAPVHTATFPGLSYAKGVAVTQDHVYIADDTRLWVINVSNPSHPVSAGSMDYPTGVLDLTIEGDYAYIAGRDLYILDISNPAAPVLVGTGDSPRSLNSVDVAGQYAYATSYGEGLLIYNITDPAHPTLAGGSSNDEYVIDVAVSNGYAYLVVQYGGPSGLRIYDLSDPKYPFTVGSMEYKLASRVALAGSYVFLINSTPSKTNANGVAIVDASDPAEPFQAGWYDPGGYASALGVAGSYAYYLGEQWKVNVIAFPSLSRPAWVSTYDTPGYPQDLEIAGNYAYFADGPQGLHIASLSDPAHPTGAASLASIGDTRDVEISGNYIYTIGSGLHVIDISSPTSPVEIGAETAYTCSRIVVEGDFAYVTDCLVSSYNSINIFNIADPAHPTWIQSITVEKPGDIDASGNFLFVINETYTPSLLIYDVSNPVSPGQVVSYPLPPIPRRVRVEGNYAYIGDWSEWGGVLILDVTDPHQPMEVSRQIMPGNDIYDVIPVGHTLFVANGSAGVEIVQVQVGNESFLYFPAIRR